MKELLVGYDGSRTAREAARVAGSLAKRLGAAVTVATVGQLVTPIGTAVIPTVDEESFLSIAEEGAEIARELGAIANARVEWGDPAQALVDLAASEGYDLIVVGHRGLSGIQGLILGSGAKAVATNASCPVLVVQGTAPETIRRVLVGIDGSNQALRALEAAISLAKAFDARVALLHVFDTRRLTKAKPGPDRAQLERTLREEGQAALAKASEVCERYGVECEQADTEGRPAQAICRFAREGGYDLVVVGRSGMGGLARLVLGSVSDQVLREAGTPVLLSS